MEKTRRACSGTLSEIFGEKALNLDKFALTIGYRRIAEGALKNTDPEDLRILESYADGVNAYISNIDLREEGATARLLPPEFYLLGIKEVEPWSPVDTLCQLKFLNFQLTWNWSQDLMRYYLDNAHEDLKEFIDDIVPYKSTHTHNLVTIMDEEDLQESGFYSEKSILEELEDYENEKERYKSRKQNSVKIEFNQGEKAYEFKDPSNQKSKENTKKTDLNASQRKLTEKEREEIIGLSINSQDQQASNNWVIHGRHTKSGKPLLASDPHLTSFLPSNAFIMHLSYGEVNIGGMTFPGSPSILIGKTQHLTWGLTTTLVDMSDIYKEKLSSDATQYYVDGQWKDLQIIESHIRVKGWNSTEKFIIQKTHRGPILQSSFLKHYSEEFTSGIPISNEEDRFSISWVGFEHQESSMKLFSGITKIKSAKEADDWFIGLNQYFGVVQNVLLAFENGDIGYILLTSPPIRKNPAPYIGCAVLDGTVSDNDWIGFKPTNQSYRIFNPTKGFLVTANNRQVPDNVPSDLGATSISTARAQRITELIESKIEQNHKFDIEDMILIQNDVVDVHARHLIKTMIKIAQNQLTDINTFSQNDQVDIRAMIHLLENWEGEFTLDSIQATVYSIILMKFYECLFRDQIASEDDRYTLINNKAFPDFLQRLIIDIETNPNTSRYNKLCQTTINIHDQCAFRIALAFLKTKSSLEEEISIKFEDWTWGTMHQGEYLNIPWSFSPLRFLFHRQVPMEGNGNTPKVSRFKDSASSNGLKFKSSHQPVYKQIVEIGLEDSIFLYSHEGGQSGNIFNGHYFDFNKIHNSGKLLRSIETKERLLQMSHQTLIIQNFSKKNRQTQLKQEV